MKEAKIKKTPPSSRNQAGLKTRQIELLYQLCIDLTSTPDETELLDRAVGIISDYFSYAVVLIDMYDESSGELAIMAMSAKIVKNSNVETRIPLSQGVTGQAARERRTVLVPDIKTCSSYIELFPETSSELACPIMRGDRLFGILNIESDRKDSFKPNDVKVIEIIAGTLAIVIENARAFDRVRELNRMKDALLEKLSNDYQNIFESAIQGMCRATPGGRFLIVNPSFAKILGYSLPEDVLKLDILRDLLAAPKEWESLIERLDADGSVSDFETRFKRSNEQLIDLKINARAVRGDKGNVLYVDAIIDDISEQKRLLKELKLRERMATMGKLAAMIAHEIRNPLTAVYTSAEELLSRIDSSETPIIDFSGSNRRLLEIIAEEAGRMEHIVRDFLNFARPSQPNPEPADINLIIEKTLGHVIQSRQLKQEVRIERQLAYGLPLLKLDSNMFIQVFSNIISNAAQAIKGEGTIRVRTKLEPSRYDPAWTGESFVVVEIADSGMGIRPADLEKIFEPFFTTKPSGTGLGLPLAKQIVELHSGTISVASAQGAGTTVRIQLPA